MYHSKREKKQQRFTWLVQIENVHMISPDLSNILSSNKSILYHETLEHAKHHF